ncbi:hypothetical protein EVAR_54480_1 [Eumeta japonica]|uniref:Uncharacterized protein n=1 Tax=Eumeta variegata TaxID=151549 RepID=A0A4C1YV61_EUMVA|nr:hypothetical protein EVAR_54480_1 [Eumeta japonica]
MTNLDEAEGNGSTLTLRHHTLTEYGLEVAASVAVFRQAMEIAGYEPRETGAAPPPPAPAGSLRLYKRSNQIFQPFIPYL